MLQRYTSVRLWRYAGKGSPRVLHLSMSRKVIIGTDTDQPATYDFLLVNKLCHTAICLRPLQVDNIFVFIRQVAPVPAFKTSVTS